MHSITPADFIHALCHRPSRVIGPALILAACAGVFFLVQPETWEASQALILRNDARNSEEGPGKFKQLDDMKTTQETILEVLKSNGVIANALKKVGPPANYKKPEKWPTATDVVECRSEVKLTPPKGAEFGKTEIFYLKVRAGTRDRASALAAALCDELEGRFQEIRGLKANSMIQELEKSVSLARADLATASRELKKMEEKAGADLAELRMLTESGSGDSVLRRRAIEIENETRQAETLHRQNTALLKLLRNAETDPAQLLATPTLLLDSQPVLKRLKDNLLDIQVLRAALLGNYTENHPSVKATEVQEQEIRSRIAEEVATAVKAAELNHTLSEGKLQLLNDHLKAVQGRLDTLASLRAEYANVAAEAKHRVLLLEAAEKTHSDARAQFAGSSTASLITRIDQPDGGIKPVSPGLLLLIAAGTMGGLMLGLAWVFLTAEAGAANVDRPIVREHHPHVRPHAIAARQPVNA